MRAVVPGYRSGFARSGAEAAWPELWDRASVLLGIGLGETGSGDLINWGNSPSQGVLTSMDHNNWSRSRGMLGLTCVPVADSINVADHASLDVGAGDFTVSAWVKTTSGPFDAIGGRGTTALNWTLWGVHTGGAARFDIDDDVSKKSVVGTTVVNDGAWHHIVAMKRAGWTYVFVDRKQDAPPTDATATVSIDGGGAMGIFETGWGANVFDGMAGGTFGLWRRGLTDREVQLLYADPLAPFVARRREVFKAVVPPSVMPMVMGGVRRRRRRRMGLVDVGS